MPLEFYRTLEDVQNLIRDKVPEGLNLEYKGSATLINGDQNKICKTVTAFANSAGGTFILGIETENEIPVRLDSGTPGPSKRDWIYRIINAGTFPTVESIQIHEIQTSDGLIYIIDVQSSPQAPHQSRDNKYYKRRGTHSEVMEHYEVEDVRSRPKQAVLPLQTELTTRDILAHLQLTNCHATDPISNLRCEIEADFELGHDGLSLLAERGLRSILPGAKLHFLIGSMIEILQKAEPTISFKFTYTFQGTPKTQLVVLHLADLNRTAIIKHPIERAIDDLGKKLDNLTSKLEQLHMTSKTLLNGFDSTGLRLSKRTLGALAGIPQMFDPQEFDAVGYRIIADIPAKDALTLHRLFRLRTH